MKDESGGPIRFRVNLHGVITAVVQQFDAGQGRTEPHAERPPVMGFVQCRGEPADVPAQKPDGRHSRQHPALPQNEARVQMADDGLFHLGSRRRTIPRATEMAAPSGRGRTAARAVRAARHRRRRGFQRDAPRATAAIPAIPPATCPSGSPGRAMSGDETADQQIMSDGKFPERFQAELPRGAMPACQPHSACAPDRVTFPNSWSPMVNQARSPNFARSLLETFPRAFEQPPGRSRPTNPLSQL